jgi:hypothetical protein
VEFVERARRGPKPDEPIVVTEGAIDCLARRKIARCHGEAVQVVAVPSSTTASAEWSALFEGRHVLVAFDPDKSGEEGSSRFAATCLSGALRVERERPRFGDWNDTLLHILRTREGAW